MFTGLYASSAGMLAQMKNLDVISNNIANINTSGFKKDKSIFRTFYDDAVNSYDVPLTSAGTVLSNSDINSLPVIEETVVDFNDGVVKETGNVFDLAIQGNGFFKLEGLDGGTYFTRAGSFKLNENRELITSDGFRLMGKEEAVKIPEDITGAEAANLVIDENGNIKLGETATAGKVSVYNFSDNSLLKKAGHSLFINTAEENVSTEPFDGKIYQGYIETSNVNPVEEMAEMITTSRAFEAYQRIIVAIMDDTTEKSINLVGRVR